MAAMGPLTTTLSPWRPILSLCFLIIQLLAIPAQAYAELSDATLRSISSAADALDPHTGKLITPILTPRVPGTPGHQSVQHHLVDFFARELPQWRLEWHNSTSLTPATGTTEIPFANIVFTRDPPWTKGKGDVGRLALVAHYDSMYRPEGFIGATDSAAPCAMLMQVARSIDAALTTKWDAVIESGDLDMGLEDDAKGVQIIFLDGEEAWVTWSETDSLYGARALAEKWEAETYPSQSTYQSAIESIKLFVLLDLLGTADPNIPSYFPSTHRDYQKLADIEKRMRELGVLATKPQNPFLAEREKRRNQFRPGYIGDDHIPFLVRGVEILHVIPTPFQETWHTMDDDAEHLDLDSIDDWQKIFTAFAAEWLELDEFMNKTSITQNKKSEVIRDRSEL
ncbi:glutaminyl-peptide cyclotransferase [Xylariaceae sp. FL1019]|nr:glutaminyl-peptide cyclotransferase [Xylariaceae sp. FL1019]